MILCFSLLIISFNILAKREIEYRGIFNENPRKEWMQ